MEQNRHMGKAKTIHTWTGKAEFVYYGSVIEGTTIPTYGACRVVMSASDYESLQEHFRGCTVDLGTSLKPPGGSVGNWLMSNVTKTKIAAHVGAILVAEGYAARVGSLGIRIL